MKKTCTRCRKSKPVSEFYRERKNKSGYMARCKVCRNEALREWYAKNPGYHAKRYAKIRDGERERHLVKKYGVTLEDYDAMFEDQGGACATCGKTQNRAFDVDHCHESGVVRGLLCSNCNRMIGHSGDSPDVLERAATYLRSSRR